VSHIPRQVAELSTSQFLSGELSSLGTVPTPSVNTHTHTHGHACIHKGVVVGERADPIHRCACRSHTHTCQYVNLHTWSGLSSLKTEMMINREKCCQRSRSSSLVHGPSSPLSPCRFPTLSRALSLDLSLVARPLSLARAHTHRHAHTHTHTHTPGIHWRTIPGEFTTWRERPRLIYLSSCVERGYMSYEENGIGHTHAHSYTYRSHTHTYT